jgi:hypothetical protein
MAYTIIKSNGTVLTTIPDGTINTTSTSLGLVGKNFAGYGQTIDTNFVRQLENFASSTPPANPLRGQLWYNITNSTMYVCPSDGETDANQWLALTSSSETGTTTFGSIVVTGNISANNINLTNSVNAANITVLNANVTANLNAANADITTANIATLNTTLIDAGSTTTPGSVIGIWTFDGSGNAIIANTGNIYISNSGGANIYGIKTDKYMYANGVAVSFAGTYSDSNVATYLPNYGGIVGDGTAAVIFRGRQITTGGATTAGNITGNWTLIGSSRLNATYADIAERFEADAIYEPGTVVELGGEKEVTAVKLDLSEDVFGVVSNTAAYLMNATAGNDDTHPPIAIGGRVKVKVIGKINKGDRLVSAGNGIARSALKGEANSFNTIGRALVNKTTEEVDLIDAVVLIN